VGGSYRPPTVPCCTAVGAASVQVTLNEAIRRFPKSVFTFVGHK
jgi:hypothetical protein